jgi:hypothetical protein
MNKTQTIKIEREYTTSDLCLAVILKMNGCKIKKIEPLDQKRFVFHFEETKEADTIINDYFLLQTQDHPYKKFYNEMREIKNMIYNYHA